MSPEQIGQTEPPPICYIYNGQIGDPLAIIGYIQKRESGFEAVGDSGSLGMFADEDVAYKAFRDWDSNFWSNDEDDAAPEISQGAAGNGDSLTPMLAAALGYAQRGWDVFPAPPGEKKSYKSEKYSNGAKWGKTRDPELIRHDFNRWPDANIGIPTGVESGIFVVETDTKKGHDVDGDAALAELEQQHGTLPNTLTAQSPSGSKHRYYKHPGAGIKIMNSASVLGEGIDVRGDGGMVIAPPSMRGDGAYRWLKDLPIADAPAWLLDRVTTKSRSNGKDANGPVNKFEIADALKHLTRQQNLAGGIEYPPADIEEIRSAASAIPASVIATESEWMDFARALAWEAKRHPEQKEALWEILDTVSQRAPQYDEAENRDRFDRYIDEAGNHEKPITLATLFYIAREHGWQDGRWEQERRAKQIAENIKIGDGDVAELAVPLILTPEEMIARLVWIGFSGAVIDRVTFRTRKKDHAFSEYAASVYVPKTGEAEGEENGEDGEEEKAGKEKSKAKTPKKTKKPKPIPCLTIWMQSPKRTTVDVLAWVPGEPQFCLPPEGFSGAQTAFNMWHGITPVPPVENWEVLSEPFVDHVAYLVPVESERQRYMQWLGHTIQHPEVLPHTAYLMVAEKTGIGRNWMSSVLVRVLRGYVAAGVSLPELLDGGFNGRLSCKLLAIVDELREGPSSRRYERAQRVKSIITEENRLINPKYGIQSLERNCCRWLMFSNFFDALPFDNTDRRIETIANPTQRRTAAYYECIYKLLHDPTFIASVWWLLKTMDLESFRPGAHATMNEAKERALSEMMTDVDHSVREFKDECGTGLASRKDIEFAAGMFSSQTTNAAHLTHAITHIGMINTGRRVKDAQGVRHAIVIVDRTRWTVQQVKEAHADVLLKAMGKTIKK